MKTLFLDVDGTLIDSFPGIRDSFLHALNEVRWPIPEEEVIARIPGPPMEQSLTSLGMPAETVRQAFAAYMQHHASQGRANSRPYPQLREMLADWRERGYRLCTATSKGEGFARRSLSEYGMLEFFDFLGAAQEAGPRRTKAQVIAHVLDTMDLHDQRSEILMIGDRKHDIEGAAEFGIETAAVAWGYGTAAEHATAKYFARDTTELDQIVRTWGGR